MSEIVTANLAVIAEQLAVIKALLIAVLAAVIVSAVVNTSRLALFTHKHLDKTSDDFFRYEGKRLLDSGKIEDLVRFANDKLKVRPGHAYARWYLARAYYLQEKWAESLAEFREVARLDPSWIDDHVKPYVKAIERKIGADTVH